MICEEVLIDVYIHLYLFTNPSSLDSIIDNCPRRRQL